MQFWTWHITSTVFLVVMLPLLWSGPDYIPTWTPLLLENTEVSVIGINSFPIAGIFPHYSNIELHVYQILYDKPNMPNIRSEWKKLEPPANWKMTSCLGAIKVLPKITALNSTTQQLYPQLCTYYIACKLVVVSTECVSPFPACSYWYYQH